MASRYPTKAPADGSPANDFPCKIQ